MIPNGYKRVTKANRCPVCGKPDWCLVACDRTSAVCKRIASGSEFGRSGWYHDLVGTSTPGEYAPAPKSWTNTLPEIDAEAVFRELQGDLDPRLLEYHAEKLGLECVSLSAIGVGYYRRSTALAFPMRDPFTNKIVGIRLRNEDGRKWAYAGSKSGLFYDTRVVDDSFAFDTTTMYVCEGPTDTAALIDIGFEFVVGRPSCNDGNQKVSQLARITGAKAIVIVSDTDEPGLAGADILASDVRGVVESVKVIQPTGGAKDARAWKSMGISRRRMESVISAVDEWSGILT